MRDVQRAGCAGAPLTCVPLCCAVLHAVPSAGCSATCTCSWSLTSTTSCQVGAADLVLGRLACELLGSRANVCVLGMLAERVPACPPLPSGAAILTCLVARNMGSPGGSDHWSIRDEASPACVDHFPRAAAAGGDGICAILCHHTRPASPWLPCTAGCGASGAGGAAVAGAQRRAGSGAGACAAVAGGGAAGRGAPDAVRCVQHTCRRIRLAGVHMGHCTAGMWWLHSSIPLLHASPAGSLVGLTAFGVPVVLSTVVPKLRQYAKLLQARCCVMGPCMLAAVAWKQDRPGGASQPAGGPTHHACRTTRPRPTACTYARR